MPYRTAVIVQQIKRCSTCKTIFALVGLAVVINLIIVRPLLVGTLWPVESYFTSPLSELDKELLMRTFRTFIEAVESVNLTYFIVCGSLIGSYRHHGLVPWDDDIDVWMKASDMPAIEKVLSGYDSNFILFTNNCENELFHLLPCHWKFFPRLGHMVVHRPYRTPYIDLFLYRENDTHIWNASPDFPREVWRKSHVFPLQRRPFEDLSVPAPCNSAAVLAVNFDISACQARDFSHFFDIQMILNPISVPCTQLSRQFPFVQRTFVNGSKSEMLVEETLKLNNEVVRKVTLRSVC